METLELSLKKVVEVFSKDPRILAVYLFGSYARGDNRDDSDLDLTVLPNPKLEGLDSLDDKIRLEGIISEIIPNKKIDVSILDGNMIITLKREAILGNLIFEADRFLRQKEEERIARNFEDLEDYSDLRQLYNVEKAKRRLGVYD